MLPRVEDQRTRKINFTMTWQVSEICKTLVKRILIWETLTDMLRDGLMVLRVCMVGDWQKNVEERRLLEFCDEKVLCVANTCFEKEQRKITHSMSGNETEIDFALVGKNNRKYLKAIKQSLGIATLAGGNTYID